MSDYISRQAAINAMESINDSICEQQAIDALCELPSEQPEIIRCKDCKHRDPYDLKCDHGLMKTELPVGEDDYCSYGERKDDERD